MLMYLSSCHREPQGKSHVELTAEEEKYVALRVQCASLCAQARVCSEAQKVCTAVNALFTIFPLFWVLLSS